MGAVVLLALSAAFNPTEIAATTVMLLLPRAERLMLGYWLGAMVTGVASGLVIVFALEGTATEQTTRRTVSPTVQLVFAGLLVFAAFALTRSQGKRRPKKDKKDKKDKKPPRWRKLLEEGNAWHAFAAGILLSFPGVSYLAALDRLIHLNYAAPVTVLIVIGFNLVQNLLIEIPMLAFKIWPKETPAAIDRAKAWAVRHGRQYGAWGHVSVVPRTPARASTSTTQSVRMSRDDDRRVDAAPDAAVPEPGGVRVASSLDGSADPRG